MQTLRKIGRKSGADVETEDESLERDLANNNEDDADSDEFDGVSSKRRKARGAQNGNSSKDNPRTDKNSPKKAFDTDSQVTHAIMAIVSFVVFLLSILASLNKAGAVGAYVYAFFKDMLGVGYFLLPTFFLLLSYSFLTGIKRRFKTSRIIGAAAFCLAGLGLIDLLPSNNGGIVGHIISTPLLGLFDLYASTILLFACVAVSLVLIFEPSLESISSGMLLDRMTSGLQGTLNMIFRRRAGSDSGDQTGKGLKYLGLVNAREEQFIIDATKKANAANGENAAGTAAKISAYELARAEAEAKAKAAQAANRKANGQLAFTKEEEEAFGAQSGITSGANYVPKPFVPPPISLLEKDRGKAEVGDIKANANIIKRTLLNFGIDVEMDEVSVGPSVTRYALKPAEGVKLSRILALGSDLALALAAHPIRIEAPIPGKSLVGIEIPNSTKSTVGLASLLTSSQYTDSEKPLMVALGKGVSGLPHFANIAKAPHMLIAGATGSGKSVTIHAIITSLLFRNSPDDLKFIMIDPKRVELTLYNKIPHLLTPVITDAKKSILALKWAGKEMSRRYDILEANSVRDIESYHKNVRSSTERMPYIAIVLDELADIMQTYPRELEAAIVRLAQMSRAVGIHLILSTQRPSVNVITGLIKANVPSRIALQVASQIDSRTILDNAGAEKLLGAGDMLYQGGDMATPLRLQSAFISESELKRVVDYLHNQYKDDIRSEISLNQTAAEPGSDAIFSSSMGDDVDGGEEDDMYEQAKDAVISAGKASTSYLQRKLGVGYSRAARLMDMLESRNIIGPANGSKPREILGGNNTNDGASSGMNDEDTPDNNNLANLSNIDTTDSPIINNLVRSEKEDEI